MEVSAPSAPGVQSPSVTSAGSLTQPPQAAIELENSRSSVAPAPGRRLHPRNVEREHEREARRGRARQKAIELLHDALVPEIGTGAGLANAVLQVAKHLDVERCDLLQLASPRPEGSAGVLYRVRQPRPAPPEPPGPDAPMPATKSAASRQRRGRGRAVQGASVTIETVQIATQQSPLELLRSEGMVDRVHVFIAPAGGGDLMGILSVQNSTSRRLSREERALLDAVGDLIGLAIDRRVLPSADELLRTAAHSE